MAYLCKTGLIFSIKRERKKYFTRLGSAHHVSQGQVNTLDISVGDASQQAPVLRSAEWTGMGVHISSWPVEKQM
jgi:hypothetical protein